MSLTKEQKSRVPTVETKEVAQMQKEMETRRLTLLKMMEDSKAKLKSLLRANPQKQFDETNPSRPKGRSA